MKNKDFEAVNEKLEAAGKNICQSRNALQYPSSIKSKIVKNESFLYLFLIFKYRKRVLSHSESLVVKKQE